MRTASILAALSLAVAGHAQAVPEGIAPSESAPDGCDDTSKYNFTIGYVGVPSKKRAGAESEGSFELTLKDGILKDSLNRVGSIVANHQFQFDGPPQAGAIYTGGFSVCKNTSLALGGTTRWWKCGSGDFFNLYDESIGGQCDEIRIVVSYLHVPTSSSSSSAASSTTESSSSSSASASSSSSLSATPLTATNGTATASGSSHPSSASASSTASSGSTTVPPAPPNSTGGAMPTRLPRRETFGAVVGVLGAALIL